MIREFIISKEFDRAWKELGLSDDELEELEIFLCKNPNACNQKSRKGGSKWETKRLKAL